MQNAQHTRMPRDTEIAATMRRHIAAIHARWKGDTFTSAALTKRILQDWDLKKTLFRIIHGKVRAILRAWQQRGYCERIATTHSGNCRRTKDVVRIDALPPLNEEIVLSRKRHSPYKSWSDIPI